MSPIARLPVGLVEQEIIVVGARVRLLAESAKFGQASQVKMALHIDLNQPILEPPIPGTEGEWIADIRPEMIPTSTGEISRGLSAESEGQS